MSERVVGEDRGPSAQPTVEDKARKAVMGPVEVELADLPKYGLAGTSQNGSSVHRPVFDRRNRSETGELVPACSQGEVDRQVAVDGHEYRQEWRLVALRRMIPFESYDLCNNPMCFRALEVVEGE